MWCNIKYLIGVINDIDFSGIILTDVMYKKFRRKMEKQCRHLGRPVVSKTAVLGYERQVICKIVIFVKKATQMLRHTIEEVTEFVLRDTLSCFLYACL